MLCTIKTKLYREGDGWTGEAIINTENGPLRLIAREPMVPSRARVANVIGALYSVSDGHISRLYDGQSIPIADPDFEIVGAVGSMKRNRAISDPKALAVVLGCVGSIRAEEAVDAAQGTIGPENYPGRALDIIGVVGNPYGSKYIIDGEVGRGGRGGGGGGGGGRGGGGRRGGGGGRRGGGGGGRHRHGHHHHHHDYGYGGFYPYPIYDYPYELIEIEDEDDDNHRIMGLQSLTSQVITDVNGLGDTRVNDLAACAHGDIADLRRAALNRRGVSGASRGVPAVGGIFDDIAKVVTAPITAPVKAAVNIAKGENVMKSLGKAASDPLSAAVNVVSPKLARTIDKEFGKAFKTLGKATVVIQGALKVITNNPVWSIVATGASFIPGIGTAVSAGMATAAAVGKGLSVTDAALMAAKHALPGGPLTAAALDVAVGVAQGNDLGDVALNTVRSQLPGGVLEKAVFDVTVATAKGKTPSAAAIATIAKQLPPDKVKTFVREVTKSKVVKGISGPAKDVRAVVKAPVEDNTYVKKLMEKTKASSKLKATVVPNKAQQKMAESAARQKAAADAKKAALAKKPASKGSIADAVRRQVDAAKQQAQAAVSTAKKTAEQAGRKLASKDVAKEAKLLDRAASQLTVEKLTKKLSSYVQEAVKEQTAQKIAKSFASIPAAASYATALATLEAAERGTNALQGKKGAELKKKGIKQGEILKTLLGKTEGPASAAALATVAELNTQSKGGDKKAKMWLSMMALAKKDRVKMRAAKARLQARLKAIGSRAVVIMPDGRMMRGALSSPSLKGKTVLNPKKPHKGATVVMADGKLYELPKAVKLGSEFKRV